MNRSSLSVFSLQNGLNALHLASKEGHVEVVAELIKHGANVDAATKVCVCATQESHTHTHTHTHTQSPTQAQSVCMTSHTHFALSASSQCHIA